MEGSPMTYVVNGRVMHRRHHPVEHYFEYPVFYLLINIDELETLGSWLIGINRRRPITFNYRDHGDGGDPRHWVRAELSKNGISDCTGSIWLQTFPRILGFLFNPVSFWYCERNDGSIGAIVAEVNNTFGERHSYVLSPDAEGRFKNITENKRLFVSPFYPVKGYYRFHFNTDFDRPRVGIDYFNEGRLQLNTVIWGTSRSLSTSSLLTALLRQPLLTLGVVIRIHWQALRLWLKGVKLSQRPPTSTQEVRR